MRFPIGGVSRAYYDPTGSVRRWTNSFFCIAPRCFNSQFLFVMVLGDTSYIVSIELSTLQACAPLSVSESEVSIVREVRVMRYSSEV